MNTDRLIALAIVVLGGAPAVLLAVSPRLRERLSDRWCVEVVRQRGNLRVATRWLRSQWRPSLKARHMRASGVTFDLPGPAAIDAKVHSRAGELYEPDTLYRMYEPYLEVHHDETLAIRDHYRRQAWATALGTTPGQLQNLWTPRETAVDASLLAAIRAHIDGIEHSHQYVDRLFSQIDVRRIFDRALAGVTP